MGILKILILSLSAYGQVPAFSSSLCEQSDYLCQLDPNQNIAWVQKSEQGRVVYRRGVKDNQWSDGFELDYKFDEVAQRWWPYGFKIYDVQGNVARQRHQDEPLACGGVTSLKAERAVIFDVTMADVRHPALLSQLFMNSQEALNGVDDDGNGLIDDCSGYTVDAWSTNAPLTMPSLTPDGKLIELTPTVAMPDVDHATQTLSIASKNHTEVAFIPVAGDIRKIKIYEHLLQTLVQENVRFMNISLGVSEYSNGGSYSADYVPDDSYKGMKKLTKEGVQTLFTVAAGNGAFFLDGGLNIDRIALYPASFYFPNILTVGAIEAADLETALLPTYKLASFSNIGLKSVDVLAPGVNVTAAITGGGESSIASGTSFAAPYVLNVALQVATKLPRLTIYEIKELIMKTVYIPDLDLALTAGNVSDSAFEKVQRELESNPRFFTVRSGGVVFPERLNVAVNLLLSNSGLTIQDAALQSRALVRAPGEPEFSDVERQKLLQLWKDRKVDDSVKPL